MIRLIIADDFDILREDLRDTLNAQPDMQVVGEAATGVEAVRLALTVEHDVLLLDIEMENTTAGVRAAEEILSRKPNSIVVFLTAHETENMILLSMGAGAVDYKIGRAHV